MSNKQKKQEEKPVFWWIFNQEEQAVAVVLAKTGGGALNKFEYTTGYSRESYRAERMYFGNHNCAVAGGCR